MKTATLTRVFTWTSILSLALVYTILWFRMIHSVEQRTGSDFIGIYTFGMIAESRGFHEIYDFAEQERVQEELIGFQTKPQYYGHVPYVALPARMLVSADYTASIARWSILLLGLNALSVHVLAGVLATSALPRAQRLALYAGLFLFFPTFSGLMNGQDAALLLLGAALCLAGLSSNKDFQAGLGLSLTTIRPQIALFLAVPFLFRRRSVFSGFAVGAGLLALISLAMIGGEGLLEFAASLQALESTIWIEPHARDMPSISGMIRRSFALLNVDAVRALVWGIYATGIGIACVIWKFGREVTPAGFGLLALFSLLLVPYAHYHDLALLLVPLVCILQLGQQSSILPANQLTALTLPASLILLFGFAGSGDFRFFTVYLVMIALAGMLIYLERLQLVSRAEVMQPGRLGA